MKKNVETLAKSKFVVGVAIAAAVTGINVTPVAAPQFAVQAQAAESGDWAYTDAGDHIVLDGLSDAGKKKVATNGGVLPDFPLEIDGKKVTEIAGWTDHYKSPSDFWGDVKIFPDSWGNIEKIGQQAFFNLGIISIPQDWGNVSRIEFYAFSQNRIAKTPLVWNEGMVVERGAFDYNLVTELPALPSTSDPASKVFINNPIGTPSFEDFLYTLDSSTNEIELVGLSDQGIWNVYKSNGQLTEFPLVIDGAKVTKIGGDAFWNSSIRTLPISWGNIKHVGPLAFEQNAITKFPTDPKSWTNYPLVPDSEIQGDIKFEGHAFNLGKWKDYDAYQKYGSTFALPHDRVLKVQQGADLYHSGYRFVRTNDAGVRLPYYARCEFGEVDLDTETLGMHDDVHRRDVEVTLPDGSTDQAYVTYEVVADAADADITIEMAEKDIADYEANDYYDYCRPLDDPDYTPEPTPTPTPSSAPTPSEDPTPSSSETPKPSPSESPTPSSDTTPRETPTPTTEPSTNEEPTPSLSETPISTPKDEPTPSTTTKRSSTPTSPVIPIPETRVTESISEDTPRTTAPGVRVITSHPDPVETPPMVRHSFPEKQPVPENPSRVNTPPFIPAPAAPAAIPGPVGKQGPVVNTGGAIQESIWTKIANLFR